MIYKTCIVCDSLGRIHRIQQATSFGLREKNNAVLVYDDKQIIGIFPDAKYVKFEEDVQ